MAHENAFRGTNMKISKILQSLRTLAIALTLLVSAGLAACGRQDGPEAPQQQLPAVTIIRAVPTDTIVYRDYPARIRGARQVQVRARVEGILEKRRYEEGQVVAKDDVLFEIDPEPFEIALRRAEASLSEAQARFREAERQYRRYSGLYKQNAVSERERDNAETEFALARARMEQAEAARDDARRNLNYTKVQAPIAGVTGLESVSEGNLIETGQLLTTITQQDPVHVRFALPETDAMIQRAARDALARVKGEEHRYEATLIMPDETEYVRKGVIDFTASTVNPETGSVTARAVFPNPENILAPGQFVRVQVRLEELMDVFLIPETAIGQGMGGTRVFVVEDENIARERPVRTGPVVDGKQVITKGLEKGDQVVVKGHVTLQNNMEILITGTAGEEDR
jgi:membrane fusion protein (multidrug efflux system)